MIIVEPQEIWRKARRKEKDNEDMEKILGKVRTAIAEISALMNEF